MSKKVARKRRNQRRKRDVKVSKNFEIHSVHEASLITFIRKFRSASMKLSLALINTYLFVKLHQFTPQPCTPSHQLLVERERCTQSYC